VALVCFAGYIAVGFINGALGYTVTAAIMLPLLAVPLTLILVILPKAGRSRQAAANTAN
jgi:hypothetical protein